jgi:hypothetical protein
MTSSESLLQQPPSQDGMHPPSMLTKPIDALYSSMRPPFLKSQPTSLNNFVVNRSSLEPESLLQQPPSQDTMHPPIMPAKPIDALYISMIPPFLKSQSTPLNNFMVKQSVERSAFLDVEKRRLVGSKAVNVDYGYGKDAEHEPPRKRRCVHRRGSKTPAMLMSLSASLVQLEFVDEEKKEEEEMQNKSTTKDNSDDDDELCIQTGRKWPNGQQRPIQRTTSTEESDDCYITK